MSRGMAGGSQSPEALGNCTCQFQSSTQGSSSQNLDRPFEDLGVGQARKLH